MKQEIIDPLTPFPRRLTARYQEHFGREAPRFLCPFQLPPLNAVLQRYLLSSFVCVSFRAVLWSRGNVCRSFSLLCFLLHCLKKMFSAGYDTVSSTFFLLLQDPDAFCASAFRFFFGLIT